MQCILYPFYSLVHPIYLALHSAASNAPVFNLLGGIVLTPPLRGVAVLPIVNDYAQLPQRHRLCEEMVDPGIER